MCRGEGRSESWSPPELRLRAVASEMSSVGEMLELFRKPYQEEGEGEWKRLPFACILV